MSNARPRCRITLARAREARRSPTDAERRLWSSLRARNLAGLRFRRQHPIEEFVLDFYCPAVRVAVELDGHHHGGDVQRAHDARRTAYLEARGIAVLRFSNVEVCVRTEAVLETIRDVCLQRRRLLGDGLA